MNEIPEIEPKDMPAFLNDLATQYFSENEEICMHLAECSMYIHTINYLTEKRRIANG